MEKQPALFSELKSEDPLAHIDMDALTPAMHQFAKAKREYPDCIIFFRMGDFYETFFQDAEICAKELGITLTGRGKGDSRAALAGIPFHAVDNYLPKLIKKGYKVAICEQVEDPKLAKGIVKREVIRVVTPGTVVEATILDQKTNNYLAAITKDQNYAFAIADISTGEFLVSEDLTKEELTRELLRFSPTEILIPRALKGETLVGVESFVNYYDDFYFQYKTAYKRLIAHFNVLNLEGFGIEQMTAATCAAGALMEYLLQTQKIPLRQIVTLRIHQHSRYMILDRTTILNLELLRNIREGTERGTLLQLLQQTITPMGARMLRSWLLHPLVEEKNILARHDGVEEFTKHLLLKEEARMVLADIYDIERLIARINHKTANARDLLALKKSLMTLPELKKVLQYASSQITKDSLHFKEMDHVTTLLESAISEEAPAVVRNGNIFKPGYSKQLDELRDITHGGKDWVAELERKEKERTGINSLKVGFTKVFGYYIEITKANLHLVPQDYIRKQTTVNGERFITPELKEKESLILSAEEKSVELEYSLFMQLLDTIAIETVELQTIAAKIATLDCLLCFAHIATQQRYVRPTFTQDSAIEITEGRHPVVELLTRDEAFVPNDCILDKEQYVLIITGPNMAGKSTFLRQVALISLMAQIGCFVPAKVAKLSICDRIFTRVGASDDLAMGQSTFMVEMSETANILNNATDKSLLILDEIGRGTGTYDGVSIAWAVAEYICEHLKAKTLFATHYHELNKLKEQYQGIENYYSAVKEHHGEIIFLRKILKGSSDRSYGIEVAKLAGIPLQIIERAKNIMKKLEEGQEIKQMPKIEGPTAPLSKWI